MKLWARGNSIPLHGAEKLSDSTDDSIYANYELHNTHYVAHLMGLLRREHLNPLVPTSATYMKSS